MNSRNDKYIFLKLSCDYKQFKKREITQAFNFLCISVIVDQHYTSEGKKNGCSRISIHIKDGFGDIRNIMGINDNKTFIVSILEKSWNMKNKYAAKALNDMRNGNSIQIIGDNRGNLINVVIHDIEDPMKLFL